jgi:ketosteroid isomerase-like protein
MKLSALAVLVRFFFTLTLATVVVRAAEPADIATVLRLDQTRLAAMMTADGPALARIFSDEILFVHSDARHEGKADYIRNMTAGDTAYTDVKTSQVEAKAVTADVIVLTGEQSMRKKLGATWSDLSLRFMSVWRRENGTWRMIAWQSLRPAGNSTVPPKP